MLKSKKSKEIPIFRDIMITVTLILRTMENIKITHTDFKNMKYTRN